MTISGDKLEYTNDISSPAAYILETKLLINSVIFDTKKGAKFLTADLLNYVIQTIIIEPEFIRVKTKYFPEDIIKQYDIQEKIAQDGYVYCKFKRGMYGLK